MNNHRSSTPKTKIRICFADLFPDLSEASAPRTDKLNISWLVVVSYLLSPIIPPSFKPNKSYSKLSNSWIFAWLNRCLSRHCYTLCCPDAQCTHCGCRPPPTASAYKGQPPVQSLVSRRLCCSWTRHPNGLPSSGIEARRWLRLESLKLWVNSTNET